MSTYAEILTSLGYELADCGTYYRTAALYRGGENKTALCVRKADGRFIDFGNTQVKGSFEDLLNLITGDKPELIKKLMEDAEKAEKTRVPPQQLPKRKVYDRSILLNLLPHYDMYMKAGISKETLQKFEVGLAQSGKLNHRYCFPIYDNGQIIGFSGRWYKKDVPVMPSDKPPIAKWKHIGQKKDWVWPLHLNKEFIDEAREVILVESPNCVLHLWEQGIKNALCLFGLELNSKMLKYLLSNPNIDRIIIATNNEPDNESIGNEAAKDIENKLLQWFEKKKVLIALPPQKDFGISSPEEIQQWKKSLTEGPIEPQLN